MIIFFYIQIAATKIKRFSWVTKTIHIDIPLEWYYNLFLFLTHAHKHRFFLTFVSNQFE